MTAIEFERLVIDIKWYRVLNNHLSIIWGGLSKKEQDRIYKAVGKQC